MSTSLQNLASLGDVLGPISREIKLYSAIGAGHRQIQAMFEKEDVVARKIPVGPVERILRDLREAEETHRRRWGNLLPLPRA